MNLEEAKTNLERAAMALDAAWTAAPDGSEQKEKLHDLIERNDRERIAVYNKILANNAANYRPIEKGLANASEELKWARDKVDELADTAENAAIILSWAVSILALI